MLFVRITFLNFTSLLQVISLFKPNYFLRFFFKKIIFYTYKMHGVTEK